MDLTNEELSLIENADLLLAKVEVLTKVNLLMEETRGSLQQKMGSTDFVFPSDLNLSSGKISRGEYYRRLPYYVLDYPAVFGKEDILAFRTMFWWGNFFSATLHLQGVYLERHRDNLAANIDKLLDKDIYLGIGDTPWEYHYEPDNYTELKAGHIEHFKTCDFLKLSRKITLSSWESLPVFSGDTLELLLSAL